MDFPEAPTKDSFDTKMASHNPSSPPSSSPPPHTVTSHPSPDLIQATTTMPSETQTPTQPIPIPTPTVFNSRLVAPNLLQFKPLTCCKCNYIMLDTEWRCNHCGHDHEYMGDDRREEKYVYIIESTSTSKAAEVKGLLESDERRRTWRDAIRKVRLGIGRGRGRNIAFKKKKKKQEEEDDIADGKEEKKKKKNKKNEKGQKGVVLSSDDTYHTLDYDENGNWVVLAGEQLVRFQVEVDGAGQGSGDHEQHGEEKKKMEIIDGEMHAQLEQRGRKDEQQQQQEEEGIQSSPSLFVSLVQKASAYWT